VLGDLEHASASAGTAQSKAMIIFTGLEVAKSAFCSFFDLGCFHSTRLLTTCA
jgi:hypothetical protein